MQQVLIMPRTNTLAWMILICTGCLRLSQVKILALLVAAAIHVQRMALGDLQRRSALEGKPVENAR